MSQAITPELRHWILEQVAAGHAPEAVLHAMRTSGWDEEVALGALETVLDQHLAEANAMVAATNGPHGTTATLVAEEVERPSLGARVARAVTDAAAASAAMQAGQVANQALVTEPSAGAAASAARFANRVSAIGAGTQPSTSPVTAGATSAATSAFSAASAAAIASTTASQPARRAMPEPDLGRSPREIDVGDRRVRVLFSLARPRVVVFGGFLSDDECDALVAAARPRMARSLTVEVQTGGEAVNADRTSDGMFFRRAETELVARIETRIARLLRWPLENGEGVQVLHYGTGAEYKPHYDYFDPTQPGTPTILQRGGQRVGTLVMYLNNPERGGGTTFPDVGLEVAPQRGHAVFFSYDRPHPSTQTLHGGAPVLAGDKWVATKWLREGEFV